MARRDRRKFNALLKKVMPYAKRLNEYGKTHKMPADPIRAAHFYEAKTGEKPPVSYDILGHFLKGPKDRAAVPEPELDALMARMNEADE